MKFFLWIVLFSCLALFSQGTVFAATQASDQKKVLAIISERSKVDYESEIQTLLKEELRKCTLCEIRNLTPYTSAGAFDPERVASTLASASVGELTLLFIDWNVRFTEKFAAVVDALKKIKDQGVLVVGSAGAAKEGQETVGLSKTLWGQIPDVIIVGEVNQRERLLKQSFFGPEMLTALKPPKEYDEKGIAPIFFVSRLASVWERKSANEWQSHFREKKAQSKKLWPGLNDFF